jgi:hypothetical protein
MRHSARLITQRLVASGIGRGYVHRCLAAPRSHPRRLILAAAVLAAIGSWVQASDVRADLPPQQYGFTAGVTPDVAGTATAPAPVALQLHMTTVADPGRPAVSTRLLRFDFDPSVTISPLADGACTATQVSVDATSCVRIGDGTMSFTVLGLVENMTVAAYQQADPQALLLLVDGTAPLFIHNVMEFKPVDAGIGGIRWTMDAPPEVLQQPAPGAYATWTDLNFTLRSAVSLTDCPSSLLTFGSHADFSDGSVGDATAYVPCSPAPPAVVPTPTAMVPRFSTARRRGRGHVLGKLLALRSVRGFTTGTVRLTCTAGCRRQRLGFRLAVGGAPSPLIRVRPALSVTKRTRISVVIGDASGALQTQRFKFVRHRHGLFAVKLPSR